MTLLWYALGIATGMYLPATAAWIMTIGERTHAAARHKPSALDELLEQPLTQRIPQQRARHRATTSEWDA